MYILNYGLNGKVASIQRGNMSIPICEDNTDYQAFLEWNKQQKEPLDLESTIPIPGPTDEQKKEILIQAKVREQAVDALIKEGKLDDTGALVAVSVKPIEDINP